MPKNQWLNVRTGTYALSDSIHFEITGNASGTSIVLRDFDRAMSYMIDLRDGQVNFGDVHPITFKGTKGPAEPSTVSGRLNSELLPKRYLPETGIEFSVNFPDTPLPQRRLRVLGGYKSGTDVRVVYREVAAGIFFDRIARFPASRVGEIVLNMKNGPTCLLAADLERFEHLSDGAAFKVGRRRWTKLSTAEMKGLVGDKVFRSVL